MLKRIKITNSIIKSLVEKHGWQLINCDYKNPQSIVEIKCDKGFIFLTTYDSLRKVKSCPACSKNKKISFEIIKVAAEKKNWTLLDTEIYNSQYINCVCDKGHKICVPWSNLRDNHQCIVCLRYLNNLERYDPTTGKIKKITREQENKIIDFYQNDLLSPRQISKIIKLSTGKIWQILEKYNIKIREKECSPPFTNDEKENIIKLYDKFETINDMSENFDCSTDKIRLVLKKRNIEIRSHSVAKKIKCEYSFAPENLTPEMSFILGVIFGDGHVGNDGITISMQDSDVIEKTSKTFDNIFKIFKVENMSGITLLRKKLVDEMVFHYKLCSNKAGKLIFPDLNEKLMPFFISGYLAADGCVSFNRLWNCFILQFTSISYNFLDDLQKFLIKETGIKNKNYICEKKKTRGSFPSNNPCYDLRFYKKNAIKICDWIFNPTTELTRCDRKYNRYIDYKRRELEGAK